MAKERIVIYNESEIAGIRAAAQAAAQVLARTCAVVRPGLSTKDIDDLAGSFIRETGGKSASLGYHGYPGQICISINEEVVHGIGRPQRIIAEGDLVSLDVCVKYCGYVGDNARTIIAGCSASAPEGAQRLLTVTSEALQAGIAAARAGNCVNDISSAVEKVATAAGYGVVRDLVGHGCGKNMHEPPEVPNYRQPGRTPILRPGMVLCIEPMINAGTGRVLIDSQDHWTVRSADHSLSAHFEHQILITDAQAEILTCLKTA
jgi:methionyl aminopeptidase